MIRFHYNTQTIRTWYNLFTFPLVLSAPLNTIVPIIETTSTLVVERLIQFKTLYK